MTPRQQSDKNILLPGEIFELLFKSYRLCKVQTYFWFSFASSCILIARTFNGRPNNVMNPSAS